MKDRPREHRDQNHPHLSSEDKRGLGYSALIWFVMFAVFMAVFEYAKQ